VSTAVIDRETGEIIERADPETLDEVNHSINVFIDHLSKVSRELVQKSRELQRASTAYKIYRAQLIKESSAGEAKQREAEAEYVLYSTDAKELHASLPTGSSIGELKDTLETDVRILRDRGHDYRSAMSALQTVASNLRAELAALNAMPT
jgi:hypothetical protein